MQTDPLKFFFFDAQHGNATYIRSPNGRHIVIDLGTGSLKNGSGTFSPLAYIWEKLGVRRLDLVVITHPHKDHLDDIGNLHHFAPKVLACPRHLTDEEIYDGNKPQDVSVVQQFLELRRKYSNPIFPSYDLLQPQNNGGLQIKCFTPQACPRKNLNNHSLVYTFEYYGAKVIIPGDNEDISWNELLEDDEFVSAISGAHVLLAPHHGREAGYSDKIFEYFSPYLTVISDTSSGSTSVTSKYVTKSRGWRVFSRSTGQSEKRYCLTTRSDKGIDISVSHDGNNTTLHATIT